MKYHHHHHHRQYQNSIFTLRLFIFPLLLLVAHGASDSYNSNYNFNASRRINSPKYEKQKSQPQPELVLLNDSKNVPPLNKTKQAVDVDVEVHEAFSRRILEEKRTKKYYYAVRSSDDESDRDRDRDQAQDHDHDHDQYQDNIADDNIDPKEQQQQQQRDYGREKSQTREGKKKPLLSTPKISSQNEHSSHYSTRSSSKYNKDEFHGDEAEHEEFMEKLQREKERERERERERQQKEGKDIPPRKTIKSYSSNNIKYKDSPSTVYPSYGYPEHEYRLQSSFENFDMEGFEREQEEENYHDKEHYEEDVQEIPPPSSSSSSAYSQPLVKSKPTVPTPPVSAYRPPSRISISKTVKSYSPPERIHRFHSQQTKYFPEETSMEQPEVTDVDMENVGGEEYEPMPMEPLVFVPMRSKSRQKSVFRQRPVYSKQPLVTSSQAAYSPSSTPAPVTPLVLSVPCTQSSSKPLVSPTYIDIRLEKNGEFSTYSSTGGPVSPSVQCPVQTTAAPTQPPVSSSSSGSGSSYQNQPLPSINININSDKTQPSVQSQSQPSYNFQPNVQTIQSQPQPQPPVSYGQPSVQTSIPMPMPPPLVQSSVNYNQPPVQSSSSSNYNQPIVQSSVNYNQPPVQSSPSYSQPFVQSQSQSPSPSPSPPAMQVNHYYQAPSPAPIVQAPLVSSSPNRYEPEPFVQSGLGPPVRRQQPFVTSSPGMGGVQVYQSQSQGYGPGRSAQHNVMSSAWRPGIIPSTKIEDSRWKPIWLTNPIARSSHHHHPDQERGQEYDHHHTKTGESDHYPAHPARHPEHGEYPTHPTYPEPQRQHQSNVYPQPQRQPQYHGKRKKRSVSPGALKYISLEDNSRPQSYSIPILSRIGVNRDNDKNRIINMEMAGDENGARENIQKSVIDHHRRILNRLREEHSRIELPFQRQGHDHGHRHHYDSSPFIPSYAVIDSDFVLIKGDTNTKTNSNSSTDIEKIVKDLDEFNERRSESSIFNFHDDDAASTDIDADDDDSSSGPGSYNRRRMIAPPPPPPRFSISYSNSNNSSSVPSTSKRVEKEEIAPVDHHFQHTIDAEKAKYHYEFKAKNGIDAKESGFLKEVETGSGTGTSKIQNPSSETDRLAIAKVGSVNFKSPEGVYISLNYEADDKGFRPVKTFSTESHSSSISKP